MDETQIRIQEEMNSPQWKATVAHLCGYARKCIFAASLRPGGWSGKNLFTLPKGYDAESIVQLAVQKTWSGKRKWTPSPEVPLFKHLCGAIQSEIHNLYVNSTNQIEMVPNSPPEEKNPKGIVLEKVASKIPGPLETTVKSEFMLGLYAHMADDLELQKILDCFFEGILENKEVAEKLSIKVKVVEAARKRLRRRAIAFRAAQEIPVDSGRK